MDYKVLLEQAKSILKKSGKDKEQKLLGICQLLFDSIPYYDWVGFYFADHDRRVLELGPYVGDETDHVIIPFGKGICGQVANSNETFLVDDVTAQDNYIACSITVKSEIVVPLFVKGVNIGQIDIDSHTKAAFTAEDQEFLENLNLEVANIF